MMPILISSPSVIIYSNAVRLDSPSLPLEEEIIREEHG